MNCSPLSATKKADLHHHARRPENPLLPRLECGLGTYPTGYPSHGG